MKVIEHAEAVRSLASGFVGLVPTMGFLHEGHLSLIDAARDEADTVVVSIFVNPTQFDRAADLATYPRDLDRDLSLLAERGVDIVFTPSHEAMYPVEDGVTIDAGLPARSLEGERRPGHFTGVATVVSKLFARIQPDRAYFGRKDAQQVVVVESLVRDLGFPMDIRSLPVVRESDGLALSSRNVRLDRESRTAARALSAALMSAADRYEEGANQIDDLVEPVRATLRDDPDMEFEYAELASAETATPSTEVVGRQFLAAACHVGGVRLIDVVWFEGRSADRGIPLDHASILYGGS